MLVLIVVVAVTAFAAFVASYEQQVLAQDSYNHAKGLESLHVVSFIPGGVLSSHGTYPSINVTVASADPNPTTINGMTLDGYAVINYTFSTSTHPAFIFANTSNQLTMAGDGEAVINLTFNNTTLWAKDHNLNNSFYNGLQLSANSFVVLNLYTTYGNDFTFTFLPPVPIIKVDVVPLGASSYSTVLDGLASFEPSGGNSTIVSWNWTGYGLNTNCSGTPLVCTPSQFSFLPHPWVYGAQAQTEFPLAPNPFDNLTAKVVYTNYTLTLVVTNSDGLDGIGTIVYSPA